MRARVAFQVEGIIESLSAESAQVSLHIRVALEMPVKETRQAEFLATHVTLKRIIGGGGGRGTAHLARAATHKERILDAMTAVYELNRAEEMERDACVR